MEKKMGTLRKAITIFILYYEEPGYFRVFMVFFCVTNKFVVIEKNGNFHAIRIFSQKFSFFDC